MASSYSGIASNPGETFFRITESRKTLSDKNLVVANPFLKIFAKQSRGGEHIFFGHAFHSAFNRKASHPTASWRQMYLSTPAVTEIEVSTINGKGRWKEACETGITIGQVADALKEYLAHHTEASGVVGFLVGIE